MKKELRYVKPEAVIRLIKFKGSHCSLCHEDADEYGESMCDIDLGKGRRAEVCCVVMRAYSEWCKERDKRLNY